MTLLGLSLTQPWASLVAFGEKRYETRDWWVSYRGPLAIAASKSFPTQARKLCHEPPFREVLAEHGVTIVGTRTKGPTHLPLGVVVAVVELVDIVPTTLEGDKRLSRAPAVPPAPYEPLFGDYGPRRYAWITRDVRRLREPVPVARIFGDQVLPGGSLGLYTLAPACEAAVRAQLGGAP